MHFRGVCVKFKVIFFGLELDDYLPQSAEQSPDFGAL